MLAVSLTIRKIRHGEINQTLAHGSKSFSLDFLNAFCTIEKLRQNNAEQIHMTQVKEHSKLFKNKEAKPH